MKALAFSPAAEADLAAIWRYSAETWGPDQADRYTDEIHGTCLSLASGQRQGRTVAVQPDYLKYPTGSHVIYFRDHGETLAVIRILHQRQDVARHLPA